MPQTPSELQPRSPLRLAISVFPWNDEAQEVEIRYPINPRITWRLRKPSSLTFSLPADFAQSELIEDLVTDCLIRIGGQAVSRMRAGKLVDNGGPNNMSTNYPFIDYRAVLERRRVRSSGFALNYPLQDQSLIVWGVIDDAQLVTNSNYGITRGLGQVTGINREWNFKIGDNIGQKVQSIADRANGFDWDINPNMELDVHYPERGAAKDVVLEYGKNVVKFSRSRDTSTFANHIDVTGGEGLLREERDSATSATDPEGIWDAVAAYPDVSIQDTLSDRADWLIDEATDTQRSYTMDLASGFWEGPDQFFLGDTVDVRIQRGRLNVFEPARITEIKYSQRAKGEEKVTVKCGSLVG